MDNRSAVFKVGLLPMRVIASAVIFAWLVKGWPAYAEEMTPDWLPPPQVRQPFWEAALPVPLLWVGDDFTHLLWNRTAPDVDPNSLFALGRLKLSREANFDSVRWLANLESPDCRELRELPALSRDWKAENSLKLPLPVQESLFMFGQFDTNGDIDHTQNKVTGRTGVGWKWSPFTGGEVQVRTGPLMKYEDTMQAKPTGTSQLSVELQAKVALLGPLQLQYAGEAWPALAQTDRNTLLQDLKLALPFGNNRELNVGAKYRWEDTLTPTPWMQRAELYLGFKFQR